MGLADITAVRSVARNLGLLVMLAIVSFFYTVQAQAGQVSLVWDVSTSSEVAGYQISYGRTSGSYSSQVDVGNQTSYTLAGLTDGATYYFAARAYNSGKTTFSGFSKEVTKTITANGYAGQVTLAWNANIESNLGGYRLYYGQASGNYTANVDVGNTTRYTLGLQNGKTYYFAVTAYALGGLISGGFSNEVSKTIASSTTASSTTATTAPTASFSTSLTSGTAPLTVTFSDTSTGSIATRLWSFGDGTSSTARSGAKTYSTANTYTMSLTVTGPGGSTTATKTIAATTAAPVAGVRADLAPLADSFADSSTGTELVAAYNFEEASGNTVVDASGKGNNGTVSGATRITQGRFGKALSFDGVNDWVTVNDSASLDLTAGMTLEAWVYPTVNMTEWATVVLKEQPSGLVYSLQANSDANKPSMACRIGGSNRNLRGGPWLLANQWTHLAASYDGTAERLYVNGTQVAQRPQTGPIQASSSPLRLGGNSVWGQFFKGRIDEILVYNRALRATEIQTDMNRSVATSSPPVTLVGTKTTPPPSSSFLSADNLRD